MHLANPRSVEGMAVVGADTIRASRAVHLLRCRGELSVWDPAPDAPARARRFVANAWPALRRPGDRNSGG